MKSAIRFCGLLNILSIDVALGAMAGAAFFAAILDVQLRAAGLLALGITVWIIYTVDHLSDARRIVSHASTERHRFHQRNFVRLIWIMAAALVIDFVLMFFIRKQVFVSGLILSVGVVVYLVFQRHFRYIKELTAAVLYTCGILLPALSLNENPVRWPVALLFFQFGMTALINLLLFSRIERKDDLRDHQSSLFTQGGRKLSSRLISFAFVIQTAVAVPLLLSDEFRSVEVILLAMNMILAAINLFPSAFNRNAGYRLAGDAVFLIPLIHLLLR